MTVNYVMLNDQTKEIYASVKKPTIIEAITLDYVGLGMYREWKEIEFPQGYYI